MAETLETQIANPRTQTEREISRLGPWFHNLHLPDGSQTAPEHPLGDFPSFKWKAIAAHLPEDLKGWTALDIGCNAGYYAFELAKRGAHVTGIDVDERYLKQARWAAEKFGVSDRVELRKNQVYDLARNDEEYDLVMFMGVFYHLRYPLLALDILASKAKRLMVFQSITAPGEDVYGAPGDLSLNDRDVFLRPDWPSMAFIEHRLSGDPTNWWVPNHAAIVAMLRSTGLRIAARPGHELYIAEPDPNRDPAATAFAREQLFGAAGLEKRERP